MFYICDPHKYFKIIFFKYNIFGIYVYNIDMINQKRKFKKIFSSGDMNKISTAGKFKTFFTKKYLQRRKIYEIFFKLMNLS